MGIARQFWPCIKKEATTNSLLLKFTVMITNVQIALLKTKLYPSDIAGKICPWVTITRLIVAIVTNMKATGCAPGANLGANFQNRLTIFPFFIKILVSQFENVFLC